MDFSIHRKIPCFLIGVGGTVSYSQFAQKTKPIKGVWMQGFILGNASITGGRVRDSKGEKDDHSTLLSCPGQNSNRTSHCLANWRNVRVFQDWPAPPSGSQLLALAPGDLDLTQRPILWDVSCITSPFYLYMTSFIFHFISLRFLPIQQVICHH